MVECGDAAAGPQSDALRLAREGGVQNRRARIKVAEAGEVALGHPDGREALTIREPGALDDKPIACSLQGFLGARKEHEAELQVAAIERCGRAVHRVASVGAPQAAASASIVAVAC